MTWLKIIYATCILCLPHSAFAYNPPEGYSGEFKTNISIALAKNGVVGCGYLVWKERPTEKGEFLIYCSRDGEQWRPYTVWLPKGSAMSGHYDK